MIARLSLSAAPPVRPLFTLKAHTNIVHGMALLPDGTVVSCSEDGLLCRWDLQSQSLLRLARPHNTCINGVALGHNGRYLLTAGDDSCLRWLDIDTLGELACGADHGGYVSRVLCAPDGTVVTGSQDGTVGFWPCPPAIAALAPPLALPGADQKLAAADLANLDAPPASAPAKRRRTKAPKPPKPPKPAKRAYGRPASSPGVTCVRLPGHGAWVYALGLSPDGKVLSGSLNNKVLIWDVATRAPVGALYGERQGNIHTVMGDIYIAPKNTSGRATRTPPTS